MSDDHYWCLVVPLGHARPTHMDQALAVTLTVALDILAISTMDNCSLPSTDEANNLIPRQGTTTVCQARK